MDHRHDQTATTEKVKRVVERPTTLLTKSTMFVGVGIPSANGSDRLRTSKAVSSGLAPLAPAPSGNAAAFLGANATSVEMLLLFAKPGHVREPTVRNCRQSSAPRILERGGSDSRQVRLTPRRGQRAGQAELRVQCPLSYRRREPDDRHVCSCPWRAERPDTRRPSDRDNQGRSSAEEPVQ